MPKKTQSTPFWLFTLTGCSPCLFWTCMCLAKAAQLCLHLRWPDSLCMTMFGKGKRWQEILRPCGWPNIFKMAAAYDGLEYKLCIMWSVCVCLVVSFHLDIQLKFYRKTFIDSAHFCKMITFPLQIFKYLQLRDWLTCADVCCEWKAIIQSGSLWSEVWTHTFSFI